MTGTEYLTPAQHPDLAGKVAVVTGGSRGIGAGVGTALAEQGARVVVTGRDRDALDTVARDIAAKGGEVHPVVADLTDESQVDELRAQAEDRFGPVDLVAAVAGGSGFPAKVVDLSLETFRRSVDANLTTTFLTLRAFLPSMIERRRGSIVTMASTAGRLPSLASPAYGAANAGVLMLTRQAALQVAEHGVRVNALAPGSVLTDMLAQAPAEVREQAARAQPLGRIGTVEDVAAATLFLLSDASAWITAATLDISGGRIAL